MNWLIVGLGNPGQRYEGTRHNIGFEVTEVLKEIGSFPSEWRTKGNALTVEGKIESESVTLMKPTTFMNVTGSAVGEFVNYFKLAPSNVIVVHDDLDLPVGTVRVKAQGGDGGHNGIKSVVGALHTAEFPRVKVGIGRPAAGPEGPREGAVAQWVLERFSSEERPIVAEAVKRAARAVELILSKGVNGAQMAVNGTPPRSNGN